MTGAREEMQASGASAECVLFLMLLQDGHERFAGWLISSEKDLNQDLYSSAALDLLCIWLLYDNYDKMFRIPFLAFPCR
jgi:hypothetical protein